jgi:hypothetical protein
LVIDDLDGTMRDSVFDCYVVSRYDNFDNKEKPKYMYLHVDVTGRYGFCIITVTIQGHLTYTHSKKLVVGKFFRLENFSVKEKDVYEKGDSDFVLWISSSTVCSSISPSSPPFVLHFLATDTISSFATRMHAKFSIATILVVVTAVRGEIQDCYELRVADGVNPGDIQIVSE